MEKKIERTPLFDCVVLHNKEHQIPKARVSEKEIVLLRSIFGDEAVPDEKIVPHLKAGEQEVIELDPTLLMYELAKKYANTADPMSGKRKVEKVFSIVLPGYAKWWEELAELENMEREERNRKAMEEAARNRAAAAAAAAASLAASAPA